jgi:hypothetical protein
MHYARWSQYRGEEHNSSGLHQWEEEVISTHFPERVSILVAAAGGGREPIALAKKGYRVDGFDSSRELTEVHRSFMNRESLSGNVWLAASGSVPKDIEDVYGGVIVGWAAYGHIPGRKNRVRFLRAVRSHAAIGAPLLLSFFPRGERSRRYNLTYGVARRLRTLRGSDDEVEYGDILHQGAFLHLFTEDEIQSELAEAGFELIEYSRVPFAHAVGLAAKLP